VITSCWRKKSVGRAMWPTAPISRGWPSGEFLLASPFLLYVGGCPEEGFFSGGPVPWAKSLGTGHAAGDPHRLFGLVPGPYAPVLGTAGLTGAAGKRRIMKELRGRLPNQEKRPDRNQGGRLRCPQKFYSSPHCETISPSSTSRSCSCSSPRETLI